MLQIRWRKENPRFVQYDLISPPTNKTVKNTRRHSLFHLAIVRRKSNLKKNNKVVINYAKNLTARGKALCRYCYQPPASFSAGFTEAFDSFSAIWIFEKQKVRSMSGEGEESTQYKVVDNPPQVRTSKWLMLVSNIYIDRSQRCLPYGIHRWRLI